jgi:hypothetical protein
MIVLRRDLLMLRSCKRKRVWGGTISWRYIFICWSYTQ